MHGGNIWLKTIDLVSTVSVNDDYSGNSDDDDDDDACDNLALIYCIH